MKRFEALQQCLPPEPVSYDILEGVVFFTGYCGLMYVLPMIGIICLIQDRLQTTEKLGLFGVASCVLGPLLWAMYNPIGLWYLLLPVIAPAGFTSYLLFINAKKRLYHRRNPTNLLPFKKPQGPLNGAEAKP